MPTYIEFPTLGKTVEVGDDINEDGIADIYDTLSRQQFRAQQGQLRAEGMEVRDEDVQRLSPLKFEHIHLGGRYHFSLTSQMPAGQFRRLRDRDEVES